MPSDGTHRFSPSRLSAAAALVAALAFPALAADVATLELRDLDGAKRSLVELRGDIVVLNFWATWCRPCREEMPILSRLSDEYRDRGVTFLAASADEMELVRRVRRDSQRLGMTFPTWVGATTADMERLGLGSALPATVILDRDGRMVVRIRGVVEEAEMRQFLTLLLADGGRVSDDFGTAEHDHFAETETAGHANEGGDAPRRRARPRSQAASLVPS